MSLLYFLSIGLTLLGTISPLLTVSALFQQKEWRMDRLMEHLRREGVIGQLWGRTRPLFGLFFLITDLGGIWMVTHATDQIHGVTTLRTLIELNIAWLTVFGSLSCIQWIMKKQRMPKWTAKAILITALAFCITSLLAVVTAPFLIGAPIILLTQPVILWMAWTLLLPVDRFLKQKRFSQAAKIRNEWKDAIVIGIAGSVGKTTVKELLRCVLQDLAPLVTPEHVNTEMGVAEWMIKINSKFKIQNSKFLIIEMGAYRTGEIALMCTFVKPTIGVMTAIGSDHLALFGSEENIIEANSELIAALPKTGHAFFYGNNKGCKEIAKKAQFLTTFTTDDGLKASNIVETPEGLQFSCHPEPFDLAQDRLRRRTTFYIPLHGLHNVGNILLAIAVARHLKITDERIAELLASFHPLAHTFNVRRESGITLVDDTYNSSRLSIRAALEWSKKRPERPRILLMSGILETGAEEERFLEELGSLARNSIERVIFTANTNINAFEKGYERKIEVLQSNTKQIPSGSILLALGRMPSSSIQQLLPE